MKTTVPLVTTVFLLTLSGALPGEGAADHDSSWIEKSNANAQVLLEVMARFGPEGAASLGVDGLDEEIFDLEPGIHERTLAAVGAARAELERRLAEESDRRIRQDLAILIKACADYLESSRLTYENMIPYFNLSQTIFQGTRGLIDPQVPAERYPAAIVRVKKYADTLAISSPSPSAT